MEKRFTFTGDEYNKNLEEKDKLRIENKNLLKKIDELYSEIEFMKTSKEDVLVVVKDKEKHDEYYFKSKEKEVLKQLIEINKELTSKNKELLDYINLLNNNIKNLEESKINLNFKVNEQKKLINKKNTRINNLENRNLFWRILNKKKFKNEI